ncbi:hypothetical protein E4U35_005885 [Claviceps purpurea]|nr:hypothetical protein E4U35_005885 [Claviceps purpurea]
MLIALEKQKQLEQDETDCYIQDIYKYGAQEEKFIVVCMLKEQAALFQQIKSIEVDMSMKRLKGNVNKEVLFACQYDLHGKTTLSFPASVDIVWRDEHTSIEGVALQLPLSDGHDYDFPVGWAGASKQFRSCLKRWRQTNAAKPPASSVTIISLPHPITQTLEASSETGADDTSVFLAGRFAGLHLGGKATAHGSPSTLVSEKGRSDVQEDNRRPSDNSSPPPHLTWIIPSLYSFVIKTSRNSVQYPVARAAELSRKSCVLGRATTCWKAHVKDHPEKILVVKDSW